MEKGKVDSPWMGCSKQVLFIDYQNNEIARRILSTIYPNCVAVLTWLLLLAMVSWWRALLVL